MYLRVNSSKSKHGKPLVRFARIECKYNPILSVYVSLPNKPRGAGRNRMNNLKYVRKKASSANKNKWKLNGRPTNFANIFYKKKNAKQYFFAPQLRAD